MSKIYHVDASSRWRFWRGRLTAQAQTEVSEQARTRERKREGQGRLDCGLGWDLSLEFRYISWFVEEVQAHCVNDLKENLVFNI